MVVCHHPFAESEGFDDEEFDEDSDFETDDYTGDFDATDDGDLDLYDDEDEDIEKCIKKSLEENILPKRQYLKALTSDQYNKIIGKDAYGFLRGNEDELIATLTIGKEVSNYFKTITPIDVREVYRIIITEIESINWSSDDMVQQLMAKFPTLEEYEAKRIIETELTRIINYAKEFIAERNDLGEYYYGWVGPLDYRTTPMCWYMQTGELRDSDRKLLAKLGRTEADLPPIPEEGMTLEELKMNCRKVARVFGHDMISDWVMHINCRHTFARGNRRLDATEMESSEIYRLVEYYNNLNPGGGESPNVEIRPVVEDDKAYFTVFDNYDSYIFVNSVYNVPTMYDNPYSTDIFVFETMNEKDVASWARMIVQLKLEKVDDQTIIWALQDMGNIREEMVINYLVLHAEEIVDRAEREGWFY